MFDPDIMRARFHDLAKQRNEIEAKAAPTRQRYHELQAQEQAIKAQLRPVLDELQALEEPLFKIDQERAILVRALAGRTGEAG
jgi:chromosome segregation ATPase